MKIKKILVLITVFLSWQVMVPASLQALTTYTWSNGTSNWNNAANWGGVGVPQNAGDEAKLTGSTNFTVTLNMNATITSLVMGSSTVQYLTIKDGNTLTFQEGGGTPASITKPGSGSAVIWIGDASGTTAVMDNASTNDISLPFSVGLGSKTGYELKSSGGKSWILLSGSSISGGGTISAPVINYGSILANSSSSVPITISSSGSIDNRGGSLSKASNGYINNQGLIKGYGNISSPVTNSGSIKAQNGTLNVTGAITTNSNGTIGTMDNTGTFNYNNTSVNLSASHVSMAGGTLQSTSGKTIISTDLNGWGNITAAFSSNLGSITATGGILKFTNSLSNLHSLIIESTGTFDKTTAGNINFPTDSIVSMRGGTLTATSGTYSNAGTSFKGYGIISASLTNNGTITTDNASPLTINGAFTNLGTLNAGTSTDSPTGTLIFGSTSSLTANSGSIINVYGTLTNNSHGLFDLNSINLAGGTINGGGYSNSGNWAGYGTIDSILSNTGTINVTSGKNLILGTHISLGPVGQFVVSGSGTTLTNNASNYYLDLSPISLTGGTLNGANIYSNSGTWSGYGTINRLTNYSSSSVATVNANNSATPLTLTGTSYSNGTLGSTNGGTFVNLGTFNACGTINAPMTNSGTINVISGLGLTFGSSASLNGGSSSVNVNGAGTIFTNNTSLPMDLGLFNLTGGTLNGSSGYSNSGTWGGYGVVGAPVSSSGIFMASGSGQTLTVKGAVTHTGYNGDVQVGASDTDTVTFHLQNNLAANDFILEKAATLKVDPGYTITLNGNFKNYSQTTGNWQPGEGFNLTMTGSTFEVAGQDYGAVNDGFSSNFNLKTLTLPGGANLELVDIYDNGNTGGVHGSHEALYVSTLVGPGAGYTANLDLNNLWLYIMIGGVPHAVTDRDPYLLSQGIVATDSPVPIPASVLLLGSGLVGLGLAGWRQRKQS